jgi:hypothetical protein
MPVAAAVKCATKESKDPKASSIAPASSPSGRPPPSGERFVQKIE